MWCLNTAITKSVQVGKEVNGSNMVFCCLLFFFFLTQTTVFASPLCQECFKYFLISAEPFLFLLRDKRAGASSQASYFFCGNFRKMPSDRRCRVHVATGNGGN